MRKLLFQGVNICYLALKYVYNLFSMLTLELSSYVLENPNDAHMTCSVTKTDWLFIPQSKVLQANRLS